MNEPKYTYGDWVRFNIRLDVPTEVEGRIYIIDKGTFMFPDRISYDIYSPAMNCLFKHIFETELEFIRHDDSELDAL